MRTPLLGKDKEKEVPQLTMKIRKNELQQLEMTYVGTASKSTSSERAHCTRKVDVAR